MKKNLSVLHTFFIELSKNLSKDSIFYSVEAQKPGNEWMNNQTQKINTAPLHNFFLLLKVCRFLLGTTLDIILLQAKISFNSCND